MSSEPKKIYIAKFHLCLELFKAAGCTYLALYLIKMFVDFDDKLGAAPIVFVPLVFVAIVLVILAVYYWRSGLRRLRWQFRHLPLMTIETHGFSYVIDFGETEFTKYSDIDSLEIEKSRIPRDETITTMIVTKVSGDIEKVFLNDLAIEPDQLLIDLRSRMRPLSQR